jgi:hypothetical protein
MLLGNLLVALVIHDDLFGGHLAAQLFIAGGNLFQAFKHNGDSSATGPAFRCKSNLGKARRSRAMAAGAAKGECRTV